MNHAAQLQKHRYNIFPEMGIEDYGRLMSDLQTNGYDPTQPIWLYEGHILDGWNRFRACTEIGVNPVYADFDGGDSDAIHFVMRTNKRRNLTSSQWACIAVEAEEIIRAIQEEAERQRREKISEARSGKNETGEQIPPSQNREENKTRQKAADLFNTNAKYIDEANKLKEQDPETFEKVKSGQTTITKEKKKRKQKEAEKKKADFFKQPEKASAVASYFIGDCVEVMRRESFNKCSLLLSDPPYAMDYKSGWNDWEKIANDKRDDTAGILHSSFAAAKAHLAPDAHIYIFGNPYELETVKPIFETYFHLKNILIWDREVIGMGDLKTYGRSYDVIYFGYNEEWKELNGIRERDVLRFPRKSPGELLHPTQKPVDILEYIIKKSTKEGEWVLDPFAGSFTTCEAAKKVGRNSIGIELNDQYLPQWIK